MQSNRFEPAAPAGFLANWTGSHTNGPQMCYLMAHLLTTSAAGGFFLAKIDGKGALGGNRTLVLWSMS